MVLLVALALVAGVAAVSTASTGTPGVRFAAVGRWFADPARDTVFRVNGVSRTVDARATVPRLEPGTEVVEGERSSYVIGPTDIRELDKSSLTVTGTTRPPARERPVTVDGAGQPYAVYRAAGKVVRLGPGGAVIEAGGPLGAPVVTPDGTLWLHRTAAGLLCHLRPGADRVTCATPAPAGGSGALSVLDGVAVFLDPVDDTLTTLTLDGPGKVTTIGADLPPGIRVAGASVQGRAAVLAGGDLLLVDTRGIAGGVALPRGRWAAPMAGRSSVVLLELQRRQIHTYAPTGRLQRVTPLPPGRGEAQLRQGQDGRVYVEIGQGRQVLVVDDQGGAAAARDGGGTPAGSRSASRRPGAPASSATTLPAPPSTRVPPPTDLAPTDVPPTDPPPTDLPLDDLPLETAPVADPAITGNRPAGSRLTIPPPSADPRPGSSTPGQDTPTGPAPSPPAGDPTGPPAGGPSGTPEEPPLLPNRPGMPPGLTAVARSTELILTWDAAPANGADVTAYEVTWIGPDGGSGTRTTGADTRTTAIAGLTRGTPYRIGVTARNAAGSGVPAVVEATLPSRWITVSRGRDATWTNCGPPSCGNIRVELFGFPPLTNVQLTPVASGWGRFNGTGAELQTRADGTLVSQSRFPFSGAGQTVWVDVDGVESNRFLWPERAP